LQNSISSYLIFIALLLTSCSKMAPESISSVENNYQIYCGSCHLTPDPTSLTKDIWQYSILPRMGIRLGIPNQSVDSYSKLPELEKKILDAHQLGSFEKIIEEEEWENLQSYILNLAPEKIPFDSSRLTRSTVLKQFVRKDFPIDDQLGANICAIEFDEENNELWIADHNRSVHRWSKAEKIIYRAGSPVVDFSFNNDQVGWCEIGLLFPTNLPKGNVLYSGSIDKRIALDSLRRPVQSDKIDLNNDGKDEIIVAEFGNDVGGLSFFEITSDGYQQNFLSQLPGAIKYIVEDLNNDGFKDIICLFAQGDESISIFYQDDKFNFKEKRVLRFPPGYGTSDFELADFNSDGQLDIITAHGDNADYSYSLKNYHGIRIFINTENTYKEKYFYPIYGSTKVIAYDFDQDGDLDIATSAFFPDFDRLMSESVVYLENTNSDNLAFSSQVIPSDVPLRSLCLEMADFDADGDQDLILGQFSISPQPLPKELKELWFSSKNDISVLFNQLY